MVKAPALVAGIHKLLTSFRAYSRMPSLSLPDRLIWFAHCPKAGGTSVEQAMVSKWGTKVGHLHWGWDKWWRTGGWRVADPPNSPQHLIWEDAVVDLPRAPDKVFAIVRDPVTRMASEYRWQHEQRRGTILGKLLARLPFSVWLRVMLAAAERNPHAYDNHFRPQSDFVPVGAQVFHLEDGLDPVMDWLAKETDEDTSELNAPHAIKSGKSQPVSECDRAFIADVFAVDCARFGYPPPSSCSTLGWRDQFAKIVAPFVVWLDRRGRL